MVMLTPRSMSAESYLGRPHIAFRQRAGGLTAISQRGFTVTDMRHDGEIADVRVLS
jgi:hypothetical protein